MPSIVIAGQYLITHKIAVIVTRILNLISIILLVCSLLFCFLFNVLLLC